MLKRPHPHVAAGYTTVEKQEAVKQGTGSLNKILTYLVFEAHGLRITLELTLSIFTYVLLKQFFPWQLFFSASDYYSILSWFSACILVALLDRYVLCSSIFVIREAWQLALDGAYEKAINLLKTVSPQSTKLITCPARLYYLLSAEILTYAGKFEYAKEQLKMAKVSHAYPEHYFILLSNLYKNMDNVQAAEDELENAKSAIGSTPSIELEEGILIFENKQNPKDARRAFEKVLELTDCPHFSGETTRNIAQAYKEVTRLWTGEAEEGFEGLSDSIDRLSFKASFVETLKPLLAKLYLERAYYLVTHKELERTLEDLKAALSLCSFPAVLKRAEQIKHELKWRHNMGVT